MKKTLWMLMVLQTSLILAQNASQRELAKLKFSNPNAQGFLSIHLLEGSIEVEAHDSDEIIVYGNQSLEQHDQRNEASSGGLRRITARSSGIEIKEANNKVRISADYHADETHLMVKVPSTTSLDLNLVNGGHVIANGVSGEHNIEVVNGSLTMDRISGSVLAHVLNEDIKIIFDQVTPDRPMSFTSLNGDIDITLPSTTKATLHCDTKNGEIYTGFESEFNTRTSKKEHENRHGFHMSIKEEVVADLNGGSKNPYTLKTMNGNILIRKGK